MGDLVHLAHHIRDPLQRYLAFWDSKIAEVEDLLVLGRFYQKETVTELERALGGLMRVREKLVRADPLGWRHGDG
ncbi:MAG TPA: hypothetical protein VGK73_34965 [Polyangiaceae bacterium]